jgi:hypothetical protein
MLNSGTGPSQLVSGIKATEKTTPYCILPGNSDPVSGIGIIVPYGGIFYNNYRSLVYPVRGTRYDAKIRNSLSAVLQNNKTLALVSFNPRINFPKWPVEGL